MQKLWLPVPHQQQLHDGDCLAACALMILTYLQKPPTYSKLLQLLNIKSYGTAASNIRNLARWGYFVTYEQTNMEGLFARLQQQLPVIAVVATGELPYWSENTRHAVVVVGYEQTERETFLLVNDPAFPNVPQRAGLGDFELAWLERDYFFATIEI